MRRGEEAIFQIESRICEVKNEGRISEIVPILLNFSPVSLAEKKTFDEN